MSRERRKFALIRHLGSNGGYNNEGLSIVRDVQTGRQLICKKVLAGNGETEAAMMNKMRGFPNIVQLHSYVPAEVNETAGSYAFISAKPPRKVEPLREVKESTGSYGFIPTMIEVEQEKEDEEEERDRMYLEYCNLGSLEPLVDKYFERKQIFPESFLWHVLESLTTAINGCHTGLGTEGWQPINHNDLHEGNVLLSAPSGNERWPHVYLTDFGEARLNRNGYLKDDIESIGSVVFSMAICHAGKPRKKMSMLETLRLAYEDGNWFYSNELYLALTEVFRNGVQAKTENVMAVSQIAPRIAELRSRAPMHEFSGQLSLSDPDS